MFALFCFVLAILVSPFKSKNRLEAENAALRHQLIILRRKVRGRSRLSALRPSCDGTEPASAGIGVGNPVPLEADRKSTRTCAL